MLRVLGSFLLVLSYLYFTGAIKGIMRVGNLATGLFLHGSLDVELVVFCDGN